MSRARPAGILLLAIALAGCSKNPPEKDVVDSMISWIGTGDMASQAWLNHTTYDRYTRQTLEMSAQMLSDQSDQLQRSSPVHSARLDGAVTNARRAMLDIAGFIAANDAPDVQHELDSLRAARKIVLSVSDSLEKQK